MREVEGKLREVTENAATARKQAVVFGRSRADLDRWSTALTALSYYARHLADPVSRGQPLEEDRRGELLREAGERIAANLDSLSGAILDGQRPEIQDIEDLMEQLEDGPGERAVRENEETAEDASGSRPALTVSPGRAGPANALHYLRRIDHALGELSTMLGRESK